MPLINTEDTPVFDENEIYPRCFIRARYRTWPEARNGLVVDVSKNRISAIFIPLVHTAVRFYSIKAAEVMDGKWELQYSPDLETIGKVGNLSVNDGEADTQEAVSE